MQLTPEELVSEFHDAVMELYFARKRIVVLEAENAALKAQLSATTATTATGDGGDQS
ncbi:hypothetical protein ACFS5L_12045 [Streptomyces phyllanthi]|uniref:hypothetical protein n=1 Tax=Streptomyces phyllanthi TaxID=1803180 RepID=UPI0018833F8F|nr:hypothetical protein [Streptomyces phyllanthi]